MNVIPFRPPKLTRVDVTRYTLNHPIYSWLFSNGFRPKVIGDRLVMVLP